jgi:hypothetical protein
MDWSFASGCSPPPHLCDAVTFRYGQASVPVRKGLSPFCWCVLSGAPIPPLGGLQVSLDYFHIADIFEVLSVHINNASLSVAQVGGLIIVLSKALADAIGPSTG